MDSVFKNRAIRALMPNMNFIMVDSDVIVQDGSTLPSDSDIAANMLIQQNLYAFTLLRDMRNSLLTNSDKYMLVDYPITSDLKASWTTYRQALRVLPDNLAGQTLDYTNISQYFPMSPS